MGVLLQFCKGAGAILIFAALFATGTDVHALCLSGNQCKVTCTQGVTRCWGLCNPTYIPAAKCNTCACKRNPRMLNECQCL